MKRELTPEEYEELKALSRIEPILSERRDIGLAKAAGFLAHAFSAKLKDGWMTTLLPVKPPPVVQTPEQIFDAMSMLNVVEK